ncbi:MAG: hypothetical protein HY761_10930 [Candidatus Omnitrophica bacterium]|nr:hypothetical protein [Candidatus Omnitrophota bacterium]
MKKILYLFVFLSFVWIGICFSQTPQNTEQLTITTYYPSPHGSYSELSVASKLSVGDVNGDGQVNSSDLGSTAGSFVAKQIGVGTTAPQSALDVNGGIKVGNDTICNASKAGTMRYNSANKQIEYCNGSSYGNVAGDVGQIYTGTVSFYNTWPLPGKPAKVTFPKPYSKVPTVIIIKTSSPTASASITNITVNDFTVSGSSTSGMAFTVTWISFPVTLKAADVSGSFSYNYAGP